MRIFSSRYHMPRPRAAASLAVALALGATLALSACASSASTTASNTPGAGGGASTPAATATKASATICTQLPGFAQAGPPPQAGAILGSIPFPANSVFTSLNTVAGNTPGLYAVAFMNVCTPNTTAATVKSNFASQLPGNGWTQSSTYPYDGGYQAPCGDPYCWSRTQVPNFLSLEKVTDAGNGLVTYSIRLAIPPSTPDCSNIAPPGGGTAPLEFFWSQQPSVPVPPLTAEGLGDGHGVGSKTVYSQAMCSPGTAASVSTFMSTELAKLGYTATNQSLCGSTGWVTKNGLAISWNVSNPLDWSLSYCQ